ncbi:paraneoplastic Ma antigen, partial [Perkinsus olseni]
ALQKAQFIMSDPFIDEAERSDQEALRHELTAINDIDQHRAQTPEQEDYHRSQEPTVSSLTSSPSASLPDASRDSSSSSPEWVDKIVNAIKKIEQKCDYCGKWGHLESDCFKKRRDRKAQATARASANGESGQRFRREYPRTVGATCGYCLKRNHTEEQCQTKRRALELRGHPVSGDAITRPNEVNAVSLETSQGNRIPLLDSCTVDITLTACGLSVRTRALMDSGSTVSIIDMDTLSSLPTSLYVDMNDAPGCRTAAGHYLKTLGSVTLVLNILGVALSVKFYVTNVSLIHPVIIGRDIMTKGGFVLRFDRSPQVAALADYNGQNGQHWKQLPSGWSLEEVVYSSDDLYI